MKIVDWFMMAGQADLLQFASASNLAASPLRGCCRVGNVSTADAVTPSYMEQIINVCATEILSELHCLSTANVVVPLDIVLVRSHECH